MGMTSSTDTAIGEETVAISVSTMDSRLNESITGTPTITPAAALTSTFANSSDPYSAYRNLRNLSYTGECLGQWNSYWAASSSIDLIESHIISSFTSTVLYTEYTLEFRTSGTSTETVYNGVFAQTTLTTVGSGWFDLEWLVSTYSTLTTDWTGINLIAPTITTPACDPPKVPACQSSWEAWLSHHTSAGPTLPVDCHLYTSGTASSCRSLLPDEYKSGMEEYSSKLDLYMLTVLQEPKCEQATITGSLCSEAISKYAWNRMGAGEELDGGNYMASTTGNKTITTVVHEWPATETIVPGCTIGCYTCRINGGTVQLIYWPPMSSTWIDGLYSAITGNGTATSTFVTLGTTLTSPTVYVSFDSLYAHDMCSTFDKTYYNEIVAITDPATLSSIWGWNHINLVGKSASFNFTDLYVSPVPDDIYQSQPRCAVSLWHTARNGEHPPGWACARDFPYQPILAIPAEVRDIDPSWARCKGSLNGVYDPPSK
jgi:hypothetical protein